MQLKEMLITAIPLGSGIQAGVATDALEVWSQEAKQHPGGSDNRAGKT